MVPHRRGRFEYALSAKNPATWGLPGVDSEGFLFGFPGSSGGVRGVPSVAKFISSTVCPRDPLRTPGACTRAHGCCAIVLPGCKSAIRAGFWPDCFRKNTEIRSPAGRRPARKPGVGSTSKSDPPAGLRPAGVPMFMFSRLDSGRNPARKPGVAAPRSLPFCSGAAPCTASRRVRRRKAHR